MAEIKDVTRETLLGFIKAIGEAEAEQLQAQVRAATRIANGDKVIDVVNELLAAKAPADFLAAGRLSMQTSMNLATRRERSGSVGGGVNLGGVSIQAGYQTSLTQETATNATVQIELVRSSSNMQGIEGMVERLKAISEVLQDGVEGKLPVPPLPSTAPATPTTPKA